MPHSSRCRVGCAGVANQVDVLEAAIDMAAYERTEDSPGVAALFAAGWTGEPSTTGILVEIVTGIEFPVGCGQQEVVEPRILSESGLPQVLEVAKAARVV